MPRFQKVLPIDFFLFRHGESEGNRANALSRQNDDHCFTKEFRERPSSTWRLTEKGMDQARAAGQWFLQNVKIKISRFYSSEYVRAMQTAGLLGIPNARWSTKILMRERDRGLQDVLPQKELQERFPHSSEWKERDPYLWTPEGGENIGSVELRFRLVLDTLSREAGRKAVLVVCHGEFMWAARKVLEGLFIEEFAELQRSDNEHDKIHNCQILHYTRRDPNGTQIKASFGWVRSICPWNLSKSSNEWGPIVRRRQTNRQILKRADHFTKRLLGKKCFK